mgnify:CR=1 FL=1
MATLFCYGTLVFEKVILRLIGRVPESTAAVIENYARYRIADTDFPGIIPKPNERVRGILYQELTSNEMNILDDYEGECFGREQVWIRNEEGRLERCWVYIFKSEYYHLLVREPWDPECYFKIRRRIV